MKSQSDKPVLLIVGNDSFSIELTLVLKFISNKLIL